MIRPLRNPNLEPLSTEAIRRYAPAIYAKGACEDVSSRYGFFPTYRILEGMHEHGFVPVEVRNYMRRDPAKMQYTKHMIRFRQPGAVAKKVGDVIPQIVLLNSHDRSSGFEIYGGMFRLVCSNGMLVSDSDQVKPVRLRHTINLVEDVVQVSEAITKQHIRVFKYIDVMRKVQLLPAQQLDFATRALALRPVQPGVIQPAALLAARRNEDTGNDLWRVFNRVQENMTKGGIEGRTASNRRTITTQLVSISSDMRVNAGLWSIAMNMGGMQ